MTIGNKSTKTMQQQIVAGGGEGAEDGEEGKKRQNKESWTSPLTLTTTNHTENNRSATGFQQQVFTKDHQYTLTRQNI